MHFKRLRLQGFKSFVDSTDLDIISGMTGIVGPNGCGKSNLVEALRWVMGENSIKRMRGSDMDDVIFAGTALRPSRNLAEVSLVLDNESRTAMAEFNDAEEITVARRIERGSGSDYRLNGKPVRQRDIHVLFADQSTGARSTSIVGQGQIDAMIRSKPQDRRQILEEASGTAGLHARRHEAELKLKGAEQNLTRVDDVLNTLDAQLRSLKQQVRQASRYRNLADHIRRTEAALLHLRWLESEDAAVKSKEALQAAEQLANELLAVVTRGNTMRAEMAAELPALRQAEAAASAIVQKLTLAREQNEAESRRISGEIKAESARLGQAKDDLTRERTNLRDGEEALARLETDEKLLAQSSADIAQALPGVAAILDSMTAEVESLDFALTSLLESATSAEVRQQSLDQEVQTLTARRNELTERRATLDEQRMALAVEVAARSDLSLASAMVEACEKELVKRQSQAEEAEQARRDAEQALHHQRERAQEAAAKETRIKAEADAIAAMLRHHDDSVEHVIDLITVTPGLENALAIAVGEALTATLDPAASQHWRTLPPYPVAPPLPVGAEPLANYTQSPPALSRCLGLIGLVTTQAEGEAMSGQLLPGQILVSRDGWAWRWDGFTVTPQAVTNAAIHLQQRNRLSALQGELAAVQIEVHNAETALQEAATIFQNCQTLDQETRASLKKAFKALEESRNNHARQEREAVAADARLKAIGETLRQITQDIAQLRTRADAIEAERAELPDIAAVRESIVAKRVELAEKRNVQSQQRGEHARLLREQEIGTSRQKTISTEKQSWKDRMARAAAQSQTLQERIDGIEQNLNGLQAKPAEIEQTHRRLLSDLSEAEGTRKTAADALIAAEQKLSVVEHQLKHDEAALGTAREERVRAEAAVHANAEHFAALRERMAEKVNCETPEQLKELAGFGDSETWPSAFELEQALARYLRERDNMGPVNLRADVESETVQADIQKLQTEKDDLVAAIAKLRQGIAQLNREARERLQNAFSAVNEKFQVLFKRMFNGGRAHLELIDNEDPLNAGLEIFACPPGKKMQVLSLLSGGERTLTALALLFAVFQTNPSPICVLDEAEAALDESNIARFCDLIKDISRETGTRFLVVTHQRVTMANMDRLYGVTMSEKGVSQLVSVDLAGAVAMRDGAQEDDLAIAQAALKQVQAA